MVYNIIHTKIKYVCTYTQTDIILPLMQNFTSSYLQLETYQWHSKNQNYFPYKKSEHTARISRVSSLMPHAVSCLFLCQHLPAICSFQMVNLVLLPSLSLLFLALHILCLCSSFPYFPFLVFSFLMPYPHFNYYTIQTPFNYILYLIISNHQSVIISFTKPLNQYTD